LRAEKARVKPEKTRCTIGKPDVYSRQADPLRIIFALKRLLDGEASVLASSVVPLRGTTDEASSPCNRFAARICMKIRAELFNFFKVEQL
jgi:hypothetical protein